MVGPGADFLADWAKCDDVVYVVAAVAVAAVEIDAVVETVAVEAV